MVSDSSPSAEPLLKGVRVVELSSMIAVPYAAANLVSLGAEVVKVEPLSGDPARAFSSMAAPERIAPAFLAANGGKRSLSVDLATPEGREIILDLVAGADVVLDNLRPGGLASRDIEPDALCAVHPQLIWLSVSGFGADGPGAQRRAVDQIIQAESGIVAATGPPSGPGWRAGFHVVDHAAAHVIVAKVLAALLSRERTGRGSRLMQSLYQVGLSLQATAVAEYTISGRVAERTGNASPLSAPSDAVRTRDGAIMLVAYLEPHWRRLCATIGRLDLLADERFVGRANRVAHRLELVAELECATVDFTTDELAALLEREEIMVGRIYGYDRVVSSEEVLQNGLLMSVHAEERDYRAVASVYARPDDGTRIPAIPALGEHTREILAELGRDPGPLIDRGVVRTAD